MFMRLNPRPPRRTSYSIAPTEGTASSSRINNEILARHVFTSHWSPVTYSGGFMDSRFREHSSIIVDGPSRAPARSYFRAVGMTDDDLAKPLVGIANTWIEIMPCNSHLRQLAEKVKEGVRAAGGTPMEFNTVAISDGESMGTEGMKTSLVSREVIADSIELVGRGYMFDAMIALAGCDKTIPGTADGFNATQSSEPGALWRIDTAGAIPGNDFLKGGRRRRQ